jgi:hypothetical protein
MRRRDREIIEIGECLPLDDVIERLQSLRADLLEDAEAVVKVDGDDYFGGRLTVTYYREITAEEYQLEARYTSCCPAE